MFHNILIEGNVVHGQVVSGVGSLMLNMILGGTSVDLTVRNNIFRNDNQSLNDFSSGIRIHEANAGGSVNGISVTGNHVFGCDQAGIAISATGRNVLVANNKVERSRGIQVRSVGSAGLSNVILEGNLVDDVGNTGVLLEAAGGDVVAAVVKGNVISNVRGGFENGTGISLIAPTGRTLEALVEGNRCTATTLNAQGQAYGIVQSGSGSFNISYLGNDCRRNYMAGAQIAAGSAIGSGNRGSGFPSAPPSAGSWTVGDVVQNHAPANGAPIGWVCTASGSPGTWKAVCFRQACVSW